MSQSAKKVLWIVFGAQVLWSLPIGLFFVWRWLAFDDPERSYICSGSRSSGKVCTDGETTNMALGIVFSVIGVIFLVVTLLFLTSWLRRRARESFLRTHGARGVGVVTEVAPTSTRVNGRTVMKVEGEILDVPGGRFVWHGFAVVPPGTQVNVAYDPGEPDDAVVLDDLKKVASSAIVREAAAQRDRADVMLDRLAQLERLRGSGSLTEAEFDRLKAEIIGDAR